MRKIILVIICFFFTFLSTTPNLIAAPNIKRIYGLDRYKTAVEISKDGWTTSEYAVIATGENYPDALCAAPLYSVLVSRTVVYILQPYYFII